MKGRAKTWAPAGSLRGGKVTPVEAGEIPDLSKLTHWHPDYLKWKTWDQVPEVTREVVADFVRIRGQRHDGTANRVGNSRPNQARFETMWGHVMRLASNHLFDPSLVEPAEEETPCQSDDDDADA